MRDYRRVRDSYEFSLEPRHVALLTVVAIIVSALLFSVGYMTGHKAALKSTDGEVVDVAEGIPPDVEDAVMLPGDEDADEPELNYDELLGGEEDELPTIEMGSSTPTPTPTEDTGTTTPPKELLYYIRVITTGDKNKADKLVESLKKDGFDGAYTKKNPDDTYKVGIKWYDSEEEAKKALDEIKGKDTYKAYEPEIATGYK